MTCDRDGSEMNEYHGKLIKQAWICPKCAQMVIYVK